MPGFPEVDELLRVERFQVAFFFLAAPIDEFGDGFSGELLFEIIDKLNFNPFPIV